MTRPLSTYRLQLTPSFTLADARAVVPYLAELGVDWIYLSPVLRARPGSEHGYDVVDPSAVSDALGGEQALRGLSADLRARGMGLLLDIVPNHMAADEHNPWWWDVLRHGRESQWARAFDIDWGAPGLNGRLLLPVLGETAEDAARSGALAFAGGPEPRLTYHERTFPLAPGSEAVARESVADALELQHYVLAYWREGLERVNYRRFFDVSDLVALRAEDPEVFDRSHELVLRLVREGVVQGLRVDHVDGLADPAAYLRRLRDAAGPDTYIVVEKILARDEPLPAGWPVEGTTGYEFLAVAGGMSVEPTGAEAVSRAYVERTGRPARFEETARAAKREVLDLLFRSDLARVTRLGDAAGFSPDAIRELTVHLDVYRTYIGEEGAGEPDRERLRRAADAAGGPCAGAVADAIGSAAGDEMPFIRAWQQLTGPVAAKGVEDTALYRDARMLARNEPGLEPSWLHSTPADVHAWCRAQEGRHPMTTGLTHDTKRGEDVRSRIAALTLVPEEWLQLIERLGGAVRPPGATEEWLLLQTLVGSWPLDGPGEDYRDRIDAYLVKALREAKERTSWLAPDEGYEDAVKSYAGRILDDPQLTGAIDQFVHALAPLGAAVSVGQLAARVIAPGAPDVYWGDETTRLTLVDPDNRRPVDFAANARRLDDLRRRHAAAPAAVTAELAATMPDGRLKLLVTHLGLTLRRRRPDVFRDGAYVPLEAGDDVFAAARRHGNHWIAALAHLRPGAHPAGILTLPAGAPTHLRDLLTGREFDGRGIDLRAALDRAPVAVLEATV